MASPSPLYVTQADLEARFTAERVAEFFSVLSGDGSSTGVVDPDSLEAAITDACAEFDEIVSTEYLAAFEVPYEPSIVEIVSIFAMFRGVMRRPEYSSWSKPDLRPYERDYIAAVKRAKEIKSGERRLSRTLDAANVGGKLINFAPEAVQPAYFSPNPTTGEGGMQGY